MNLGGINIITLKECVFDIIDSLYPKTCPICFDIVIPAGNLCCKRCEKKLTYICEPRCKKCSKPLESEIAELCYDCTKNEHLFIKGFSALIYDDIMKASISRFKYSGKSEYADFYAKLLYKQFCDNIVKLEIDALLPVPIHKDKMMVRGYNQAGKLADKLSKLFNIPIVKDVLIRRINTFPQKELNNIERKKNINRAFSVVNKDYFINHNIRKVMIIDDIYTTGSTVEACTRVLQKSGITDVYFMSICIGYGS